MAVLTADGCKRADVAGRFYPGDPDVLTGVVDHAVAAGRRHQITPKALIAPHAGYPYSGAIAGTAYAQLGGLRDKVRRVVIVGPPHRRPVAGIALPGAASFETPIGPLTADRDAETALLADRLAHVDPAPFEGEHGIEVHLPFIRRTLGEVRVLAALVGDSQAEATARMLRRVWGGEETLIVVSSDLSHYLAYDEAKNLDGTTGTVIERLDAAGLKSPMACGHNSIRGLIGCATALDMRCTALDLRNSGDTAGGRDSVVGYGAFAFEYAAGAGLPTPMRGLLLRIASDVIGHGVRNGAAPRIEIRNLPPELHAQRASFVTLTLDGRLRGCIGSVTPQMALFQDVARNAYQAAFGDKRFAALTGEEYLRSELEIAILSTPRRIPIVGEAALVKALNPDKDGLIIRDRGRQALFLPKVWSSIPHPAQFVRQLKRKAGLAADHWSDSLQAFRFSTESFSGAPPRVN